MSVVGRSTGQFVGRLEHFFHRSVTAYPNHVALERPAISVHGQDVSLTYSELDKAAEILAARIRLFVRPDDIVMLAFPRTDVDAYVALLAVLKSGAAYCALDLSFPDDRIRQLIDDASPRFIMTSESLKSRFQEFLEPGLRIFSPEDFRASKSIATQTQSVCSTDLAYVIYTSGTTGMPKGVMIEHGQISNLIESDAQSFDFGPNDRVLQGSSLSYDSSVEEIFMGWAAGSTVVVGSDETVRLGPDLVDWLIARRITVFAPPPTLLRTMGGANVSERLSELRFLYVGGEALTEDVVNAWAPGRVLINGYGPTECSVTVVRGEVRAGSEISIGRPVVNHVAYVLNEALEPVALGENGELCITGAGVSRGYLNRSELTREKFPTVPGMGRIYRTGDLVSEQADGTFLYHGRIDTQVKLRGYRLELTSIETHLCKVLGIKSAVCTVQDSGGKQSLVAFVTHERPESFSEKALKQHLSDVLPSYMVPSRIVRLDELPKLTSGKLARKQLPVLDLVQGDEEAVRVEPSNQEETLLAEKMASALGLVDYVCVDKDFFELGGDSLAAALLISDLRCVSGYEGLTVRDVYLHRTASGLAEMVQELNRQPQVCEKVSPPSNVHSSTWSSIIQLGILILMSVSSLSVAYGLSFGVLPWCLDQLPLIALVCGLWLGRPLLGWLWLPVSVLCTRAVKSVLIGRYTKGKFPVWGSFYIRHWLVRLVSRTIPWSLVSGTVLHNWVLRQLGANIGQNVYLHRGVSFSNGGWDLVTIGSGATLGRDVALRPIEYLQLEGQMGPIEIGAHSTLETRSGVCRDGTVGTYAEVAHHACVRPFESVPSGRRWLGSVGEAVEKVHPVVRDTANDEWSERGYALRLCLSSALVSLVLGLPVLAILSVTLAWFNPSPAEVKSWLFDMSFASDGYVLWLAGAMCVFVPISLAYRGLVSRCIPNVRFGTHSVRSAPFMYAWLKESLMETASKWLSGTLYWPFWLRLSGMRVGPDCEISTIMEVVPEHIEIKGKCFSADGIYFSVPSIAYGQVTYRKTTYESGVFLGNHAVIESGTTVPEGVLLGVCTVAPKEMGKGTSWFGTPTFELPNREVVLVDDALTHNPSKIRYLSRLFWETLRFSMPAVGFGLLMAWFRLAAPNTNETMWMGLVFGAMVGGSLSAVSVLMVWGLKWALLGRVKPGQHTLWSYWCSRWDFVYVFWGVFARPVLAVLEGTQLMNVILRCFGVSIGKRVFLGAGFAQVVDPDMLNFEDESTVVNLFQAHSFEDRVLKIAPVVIEASSSVGEGTVMLYGAKIGQGSIIGEQSVVMKNERLSPVTSFAGAPTRPMNRVVLSLKSEGAHKALDPKSRAV
jgi:non-ribosomal peptide synthetase-like protein